MNHQHDRKVLHHLMDQVMIAVHQGDLQKARILLADQARVFKRLMADRS